jgi:hypothetical protein
MRVELLLIPGCPNAEAARAVLTRCLDQLGLDLAVLERVGDHPSPTVLVDGIDVMSDTDAPAGALAIGACRVDVPTPPRVLAALRGRLNQPGRPAGPVGELP